MRPPLPYARCRGDWFLRLLGSGGLALLVAFVAAIIWKATA